MLVTYRAPRQPALGGRTYYQYGQTRPSVAFLSRVAPQLIKWITDRTN